MKWNLALFVVLFTTALNAQNPFDNLGILHNKGLEFLIQSKTSWLEEGKKVNEQRLMETTVKFMTEQAQKSYGGGLNTQGFEDNLISHLTTISTLYKEKKNFDAIISSLDMNATTNSFIRELLAVDGQYDEIIASIKIIEGQILEAPFEGQELCLLASATLRHSYSYLYITSQDPDND